MHSQITQFTPTIKFETQKGTKILICVLIALWHCLEKGPKSIHLFQAAAPDQFAVVNCNIWTTITHILLSISFNINRLDNHETLDVCRSEKVYRINERVF